jgi:hypothetical protein
LETARLTKQAHRVMHELNDFTVVMGSLELLHENPDLPVPVHQLLTAAREQPAVATARVDAFQRIVGAYASHA